MKKLLLLLTTTAVLLGGETKTIPVMTPIEIPQTKEVVLLGGISATHIHKDCGCDTSTATHIGATLGADYLFSDYLGVSARLTSNWLQTGVYGRVGGNTGAYGLLGLNHSWDMKDTGLSGGVGYAFDGMNLEIITSKIGDNVVITPSFLLGI